MNHSQRRTMDGIASTPPAHVEPITIGSFTLAETGLVVNGSPTFAEYSGVGDFIHRAVKASGWWAADWLKYGRHRQDWKERLDALLDVTDYSDETARKLTYLGENVASERRRADVDISAHFEVAPLSPKEQDRWLAKTAEHGWSVRELRAEIRAAERTKILSGQAPTIHTVDVTVRLTVEAAAPWAAQDIAWGLVKAAVAAVPHAHVIGARALRHGDRPTT